MEDIVKEFLVESYEGLDQVDRDLLALEQDPTAKEILSRILRTMHSMKGTCGFLGFTKLEALTHNGENLFIHLRDGNIVLNSEIATCLLKLVDAVREILSSIESTESEGTKDYSGLVETLERLQGGKSSNGMDSKAEKEINSLLEENRTKLNEVESESQKEAVEAQQQEKQVNLSAAVNPYGKSSAVNDASIRVDCRVA